VVVGVAEDVDVALDEPVVGVLLLLFPLPPPPPQPTAQISIPAPQKAAMPVLVIDVMPQLFSSRVPAVDTRYAKGANELRAGPLRDTEIALAAFRDQPPLVTGFDDSVMNPPLIQTPQRPPQAEVHTTGCPAQFSAGFGGAHAGTSSPTAGSGGRGWAAATDDPRPKMAAVRPPATTTADRADLITDTG
jgi:hypothetical protein